MYLNNICSWKSYWILIFLLTLSFNSQAITNKYDHSFRKWSAYYSPEVPWHWLKAQCWQESRFKADAVSPVGAQGVCQFMPPTWSRIGLKGSPFTPDVNIQAAASYMKDLRKNWNRRERTLTEIQSLALASYNAGLGNILKAQVKSGDKKLWCEIKDSLSSVTGNKNSKETIHYVEAVWKYVADIEGIFK